MKNNQTHWSEMSRVLSGEASASEMESFFESLEKDTQKRSEFEQLRIDWEASNNAMIFKGINEDLGWEKQKDLINSEGPESTISWTWLKWAAVLLIGFGITFWLLTDEGEISAEYTQVVTNGDQNQKVNLPDGSIIYLNKTANLKYLFTEDSRKLVFEGEAYFEVAKDADRPFVIELENSYIKVLGTSFNVNSNVELDEVFVKEGLVEFGKLESNEKILLEAGAMANHNGRDLSRVQEINQNVVSWHTKSLVFDSTSLHEVLTDLESTYNVSFRFDSKSVSGCNLTANFTDEKLENVLSTINVIFNVSFTPDGTQRYVVTGQGCN